MSTARGKVFKIINYIFDCMKFNCLKTMKRPELSSLSVGIMTLPLEENIEKIGAYNSANMWIYCSHNGMCYHKGALAKLDEYTEGDIITVKVSKFLLIFF